MPSPGRMVPPRATLFDSLFLRGRSGASLAPPASLARAVPSAHPAAPASLAWVVPSARSWHARCSFIFAPRQEFPLARRVAPVILFLLPEHGRKTPENTSTHERILQILRKAVPGRQDTPEQLVPAPSRRTRQPRPFRGIQERTVHLHPLRRKANGTPSSRDEPLPAQSGWSQSRGVRREFPRPVPLQVLRPPVSRHPRHGHQPLHQEPRTRWLPQPGEIKPSLREQC